jgi:sodium/proline symporter
VQASLMIFALILTPVIVIFTVAALRFAGSDQAEEHRKRRHAERAELRGHYFADGLGLGYFGQPHILARFMAADSHHSIVHARRISMTWMILCLAGPLPSASSGSPFNNNPAQAGAVNQNAERVFIELAQILFNPWIAGILLSAILAAVMSTLSCQLLVCSSALPKISTKRSCVKTPARKSWCG